MDNPVLFALYVLFWMAMPFVAYYVVYSLGRHWMRQADMEAERGLCHE